MLTYREGWLSGFFNSYSTAVCGVNYPVSPPVIHPFTEGELGNTCLKIPLLVEGWHEVTGCLKLRQDVYREGGLELRPVFSSC